MTLALILAAQLAAQGGTTLQRAQSALEAGHVEEAQALFDEALAADRSYAALVGLGVVMGREGQTAEAENLLSEALSVDRRRPDAWLERGGVRFLERRYQLAVGDLEAALDRGADEPYARDLLATSLHLAGRPIEALAQWNRLGQPTLRQLNLTGVRYTRADIVRAEILPVEGRFLSVHDVRATRLRLQELGVFGRVTLRAEPLGHGLADLDVAVVDRRGVAQSRLDLVGITGMNLLSRRVQGRYLNLFGTGTSLTGRWRWEANRPEIAVQVDWPRPFGRSGRLQLVGRRSRQRYALDEELDESSRSVALRYRRVLGARTVGFVSADVTRRAYSRDHPQALPGWTPGLGLGSQTTLVETYRQDLELGCTTWVAMGQAAGRYGRVNGAVTYRVALGPAEELRLQRTVLAFRVAAGLASARAPIGEWFAPGSSPELEWPLRAHRQTRHGVIGTMPLTRRILMANAEWRQRVIRGALGEIGLVPFLDAAWLGGKTEGDESRILERQFMDCGIGLRLALAGGAVLRGDLGFGISDRSRAFSMGVGHTF